MNRINLRTIWKKMVPDYHSKIASGYLVVAYSKILASK